MSHVPFIRGLAGAKMKTPLKAALTNRLSEREVRERLALCSDPEIIDELYTFGQMMLQESIENTRALDSKAASIATYGGAIVTLLVSTSADWVRLGNTWTLALGAIAGITAFASSIFAVRAMALRNFEWISQKEWLEEDCISQHLARLKGFRILTIWGAMDSHKESDLVKVERLKQAQRWLSVSVFVLLLILLHIGWIQGLSLPFRAALWKVA